MTITSGQFFSAVLMGIIPTALGRALARRPTNLGEWHIALDNDIQADPLEEDPIVVQKFHGMLRMFPTIYSALLTRVYTLDATTDPPTYVPDTVGRVMVGALNAVGNQDGFLTFPWTNPPHAKGADVLRMDNFLSQFDETTR